MSPDFRVKIDGRTYYAYEGEFTPLAREGARNLRYKHHPIAVLQEMMSCKSFRHISQEDAWPLIKNWGSRRVFWGSEYPEDESRDYDLESTLNTIAYQAGASCLCCNNMAWTHHKECGFEGFRSACAKQSKYLYLFFPELMGRRWPVLCKNCYVTAESAPVKKPYRYWQFDKTLALRGLLQIMKHNIGSLKYVAT
jgi:hypothetical protein